MINLRAVNSSSIATANGDALRILNDEKKVHLRLGLAFLPH